MSSQSFADLGVSKSVVGALRARRIHNPFAIQRLVIADGLAGHDLLAQSPTGSGKTLAFGLPLIDRLAPGRLRPTGLVLAPTRELAAQIADDLRPLAHCRALSVAVVYGGVGIERQSRLAARAHIVVATPGRLEDLLGRGDISLEHVQVLVVDEADRMLDMGFKPAVDRLLARMPADRQTMFFSATLEGEAGRVARTCTRGDARRYVHAPAPASRAIVHHRFVHLAHDAKLSALVAELRSASRGRTLVFVRTKRGADRLVKRLRGHELDALAMHGDKSQSQRTRALARFESGAVQTLVATDVAARGIDVADITHVIQFDAPADRDAYVHRVGRTGRAGQTGTGVSFVIAEQRHEMRRIAADLGLTREFERDGSGARGVGAGPRRAAGGRHGGRARRPAGRR